MLFCDFSAVSASVLCNRIITSGEECYELLWIAQDKCDANTITTSFEGVKKHINRQVHFMCIMISTRIRHHGPLGSNWMELLSKRGPDHIDYVWERGVALPKTLCALSGFPSSWFYFPPLMHSLIFNIFWSIFVFLSWKRFFFFKEILFLKLEIPEIYDILLHLALHLSRESEFKASCTTLSRSQRHICHSAASEIIVIPGTVVLVLWSPAQLFLNQYTYNQCFSGSTTEGIKMKLFSLCFVFQQ